LINATESLVENETEILSISQTGISGWVRRAMSKLHTIDHSRLAEMDKAEVKTLNHQIDTGTSHETRRYNAAYAGTTN